MKIEEQDDCVVIIPYRSLCDYKPNKQLAEVEGQTVQYMHRWQSEDVKSQRGGVHISHFQEASDL